MDGFASLSTAVGDQIVSDKPQLPVWRGFHPITDHLPQAIPQEKAREALGWPQDKKIVLFFGFGVFTASQFGGTIALGLLVSLTLLIAMASNLILLPSLLLFFDHWVTTKAFKSESIVVLIDEEEDIDLDELEIK